MVKAIIFDLDGTLLDTSADIQGVINGSLKRFGLPEITLEKTIEFVGNGAKKLVERAVGERKDLTEAVYADYAVNFAACNNKLTKLYAGEEVALEEFNKRNIKLAIVTNKPQDATDNVYNEFLSRFSFCKVVGQSAGTALKPNPAETLKIIDEFNVGKKECLFVGDGETDVQTAKRAGIRCVSALWGYRSRTQLQSAGAKIFAENFRDLQKLAEYENFENF